MCQVPHRQTNRFELICSPASPERRALAFTSSKGAYSFTACSFLRPDHPLAAPLLVFFEDLRTADCTLTSETIERFVRGTGESFWSFFERCYDHFDKEYLYPFENYERPLALNSMLRKPKA